MRSAKYMAAAALLFLAACTQTTQEKGESLFEGLDPPTLNKLRGVYSSTANVSSSETVEIRLRFTDGSVIGAGKCVKTGAAPVVATAEAVLDTSALDAPTGKLSVQELLMKKDTCEAGLPAATYDFKVEEDKLTLWIQGQTNERIYKKIGD